jgi:Na+-transporting NADH:ubiquinone oxidoreductase subunit NqrF
MTVHRGAAEPAALADTFEIYLAWSDKTLLVRPGQTALQVLVEGGVAVEPGCQTGGCGMCATAYVEGDERVDRGVVSPLGRLRALVLVLELSQPLG